MTNGERNLDDLLPAIASGNADSFATWMVQAEPRVRLSLRRFAAAVDVEVVVQETLLKIWQVAPRVELDGRPNALLRLAVRIARNQAISDIRRSGARPQVVEHEVDVDAAPVSPPDPHLRRALDDCRDALPPKPRSALDQRLFAATGLADADLAAQVGMTKNTFLQNITRARKLLEQCLDGKGVNLESELA